MRHAYFVDQKKAKPEAASGEKKKLAFLKDDGEQEEDSLLHIVMDYIPTNVYRV